jgi:hypothetical protein
MKMEIPNEIKPQEDRVDMVPVGSKNSAELKVPHLTRLTAR